MTTKNLVWSFSSLKLYEQCPKKYYHLRIAKDTVEPTTEAQLYGTVAHEAAEKYVKDGIFLSEGFLYMKDSLDVLRRIPGEKLCEYKLGLTEDMQPCDFAAKDVYFRGIADLIILDRDMGRAFIVDYKTGKSTRYADTGQLELMALAVFKHFPEVEYVRAGLLFTVARDFIRTYYKKEELAELPNKFGDTLVRMKSSIDNGVFNFRLSGLCRAHCAVMECPHNGKR